MLLQAISDGKNLDVKTQAKRLENMKYRGYIKGGKGTYRLTTKGRHILNEENVWSLTIPTPPSWDKKWRIVLFDIPKDKRKRRDAFRLRIKELGLVLYQNSVWVYPYPLEETVRAIATFYHLSGCVSFITAEHISGEKKLRSYFNLTY